MLKFHRKIILSFCVVLVSISAIGQKPTCDRAKQMIFKFVQSEKANDWDNIEDNAFKYQSCKCSLAPIFYYIHRMQVLLPNSHTLTNVTPDEFIANQELQIEKQIQILKKCSLDSYQPLLNTMKNQHFDSEIANTAKKLQNQLSMKK